MYKTKVVFGYLAFQKGHTERDAAMFYIAVDDDRHVIDRALSAAQFHLQYFYGDKSDNYYVGELRRGQSFLVPQREATDAKGKS